MSQETVASLEEQLNTALAELETERQRTRAANNKAAVAERKLAQALRKEG